MRNKKKILIYSFGTVVILCFVTVVAVAVALDSLIKATVESVGPKMTRTEFTLDEVDIRLLSGYGKLSGLLIGNPEGYSSDFAIKIDEALLDLHPGTLWNDKLVVESIQVISPEIIFEGGATNNNLREIVRNIEEFVGSPDEREQLDRRLQVNHFLLSEAKVHLRLPLFGKRNLTLTAPEIELHNLGTGPDGITSAELTEMIIGRISEEVSGMMTSALRELGRSPENLQ